MKRIISFVLVILLLLISTTIISVSAEETNDFEKMPIKIGDEIKFYNVIKSNDDYLIEVENLGGLTHFWVQAHGYSLNSPQNKVIFNRGSKQVVIDLLTNTINIGKYTRKIELTDIRTNIDGYKIYVPMAQLLPWLNSYCLVDEQGVFNILVDEISIWDILEDFNIDDYSFDFVKECEKGGVNSNLTKASSYIKSKGIGMVLDIIPIDPFDGITAGSHLKYYEIFDEMIRDKTSSNSIIKELFSKNKKANAILGLFEKINTDNIDKDSLTYAFPSAFKDLKTYSDVLKKVEDASKYITYLNAFEKSDETILEILNSITLNRESYKYDDAMLSAVFRVKKSYTNKFDGIVNMFCNKLVEDSVSKVITKGMSDSEILSWCLTTLKLEKAFSSSADKQVAKIPNFESIGSAGKTVFKDSLNRTDLDSIKTLRQHAILYLYSMEKCYSAMKSYYSTRDNWEYIAMSYDTKIEKCQEMRGKFEATGLCETEINDSSQYYKDFENKELSGDLKDNYVKEIKELFKLINFDLPNFRFVDSDTQLTIPAKCTIYRATSGSWPNFNFEKYKYIDYCETFNINLPNGRYRLDATPLDEGHKATSITFVQNDDMNIQTINIDKKNQAICNPSDYTYHIKKDGTGEITGYKGNDSNIRIPSQIDDVVITSIEKKAFMRNYSLKCVVIANTITEIGDYAFYYCTELENVVIPNNVTLIGNSSFAHTGLIEIDVPSSVTTIQGSAFFECQNLKKANIQNGIKSICYSAFENCVELAEINIPDSVNYVEKEAFNNTGYYNNTKNWENGLLYIDNVLIKSDGKENEYNIRIGTKVIADEAFIDNINLQSCHLADSVYTIGASSFKGCKKLVNIYISKKLNIILGNAFEDCNSINSITLPDGLRIIGFNAFLGCNNLKKLIVPASVTFIESSVGTSFGGLGFGECKTSNGTYWMEDATLYFYANTYSESYILKHYSILNYSFIKLVRISE